MSPKDRQVLAAWLRSRASLKEVEAIAPVGLVENERFTPTALRAFRLLWTWSAFRFSGPAGRAQDRFFDRRGPLALTRRIERAQRHAARLMKL